MNAPYWKYPTTNPEVAWDHVEGRMFHQGEPGFNKALVSRFAMLPVFNADHADPLGISIDMHRALVDFCRETLAGASNVLEHPVTKNPPAWLFHPTPEDQCIPDTTPETP